jgi:hypothetical protein
LAGPEELPPFVVRNDWVVPPRRVWKKAAIDCYGSDGLSVRLQVRLAIGQPLAFFPEPQLTLNGGMPVGALRRNLVRYDQHDLVMRWSGTLSDRPQHELAKVASDHSWAAARRVPSSYFNTDGQSERFLFYQATTERTSVVKATVTQRTLEVHNPDATDAGPAILLINDGQARWGRRIDSLPASRSVTLNREEIVKESWTADQAASALRKLGERCGLSGEEAKVLAGACAPQLADHLGFLLICRIPRAQYEQMVPLSVYPEPTELIRVGLVADPLDGQAARSAWLPAVARTVDELVRQLSADDFAVRRDAERKLAAVGDLARMALEQSAHGTDPEAAKTAALLLEELRAEGRR